MVSRRGSKPATAVQRGKPICKGTTSRPKHESGQDCWNHFSHLNFVLCLTPFFFSIYSKLKNCVDDWANASCCRGYSFLADKVFLKVHDMYFLDCGQVQDPPLTILIMLIAPVTIVTLLLPLLCVNLTTLDTEMPSALGL